MLKHGKEAARRAAPDAEHVPTGATASPSQIVNPGASSPLGLKPSKIERHLGGKIGDGKTGSRDIVKVVGNQRKCLTKRTHSLLASLDPAFLCSC